MTHKVPLENAVKEAGKILLKYFRNPNLVSKKKTERDIVTEADFASEKYLFEVLKQIDDIDFLSEESYANTPLSEKKLWIIDPLDGTVNFSRGIPYFAVSVAHYNGDFVDFAACYIPVTDEFFYAEKSKGAFLNNTKISSSSEKDVRQTVVATGFADITKGLKYNSLDLFKSVAKQTLSIRRIGSAVINLLYTATGFIDFFWESGLSIWDMAAGSLIAEEAGCIVTDFYGTKNYLKPEEGIIVSGTNLYDFIKNEIKRSYILNR